MNRTVHKFCAWSGTLSLALMVVGFVLLAGFIPARSPSQSAPQTAQFLLENRDMIKWGLIVSMFAAPLLMPFSASISIHMRRIEGRYPALAMTELGLGAILVLEFVYLIFFWQTATFRTDRAPELIHLLDDMEWIPFVGLTSTIVLQVMVLGVAILLDRRERPVFPRWLGYYNLWVALMFLPGTFNVFYQSGPRVSPPTTVLRQNMSKMLGDDRPQKQSPIRSLYRSTTFVVRQDHPDRRATAPGRPSP